MTISLYHFLSIFSLTFVILGSSITLLLFRLAMSLKNKGTGKRFSHRKLSFKQKVGFNLYISLPSAIIAIILSYCFINSPVNDEQYQFLKDRISTKKIDDAYVAKYLVSKLSSDEDGLTQGEFQLIQYRIGERYNYLDLLK